MTVEAGLDAPHSDLDLIGYDDVSSGVAVADVDADGDQDLFLPRIGMPNSLYLNDGSGVFDDIANQAGVAGPQDRFGSSASAFGDFNGDGHLDLFAAGARGGQHELFINNGDMTFTDQATERGIPPPKKSAGGLAADLHDVAVADVNGDGHMDLLLLQWYPHLVGQASSESVARALDGPTSTGTGSVLCSQIAAIRDAGFPRDPGTPDSDSALLLNDGTGHFTDVSEAYGLPFEQIMGLTAVFTDLDGDGWQDLAIAGDNCTSRLFRNVEGSRFEDVTEVAGVGTDENGMGAVVRDVNRDGNADWFITSISYPMTGDLCVSPGFQIGCSGNRLYLGDGSFRFRDATDEFGLRDGAWGWGASVDDLDNDGSLEFVATNGYSTGPDSATPDADPDYWDAFDNDTTRLWSARDGRYVDVASEAGIADDSVGHGLVTFDMDSDGDLDLLVVPSGEEAPRLWRNNTLSPGDSNDPQANWLSVHLEDPHSPGNRWGDGAKVTVRAADGIELVQWVTTGGSYETQRPAVLHFGLGEHRGPVQSVEVLWPQSSDPQVLEQVETGRDLFVIRTAVP